MKKLFPFLLCILLLSGCAETYDGPTVSRTVCSAVEQTYYGPDDEAYQHYRTEYAYDIYGNQSQVIKYNEDEPTLKTVRYYDENGNIFRKVQYDVSGWFPKRTVDVRYTYDDQGRLTSTTHRGELSWDNDTTVYDDEAGTRTYTGYNGTAIDYMNELGWVMRTEQTFSDGQTVLTEYDRRSDGQIETMRTYTQGVLTSETVMTYDDQGRILTQTKNENGVSTLLFSWEYGEDYKKCFDSSGSITVTGYRADGATDYIQAIDAQDRVISLTLYRYTEIQVPVR